MHIDCAHTIISECFVLILFLKYKPWTFIKNAYFDLEIIWCHLVLSFKCCIRSVDFLENNI